MNARKFIRKRRLLRRAYKLEFVIKTCGFETALRYGYKRGWILKNSTDQIWLADL